MFDLVNILYYVIHTVSNETTTYWVNYNENTFVIESDFEKSLSEIKRKMDKNGFPSIDKLDDIYAIGGIQLHNGRNEHYRLLPNYSPIDQGGCETFDPFEEKNNDAIKECSFHIATKRVNTSEFRSSDPFEYIINNILHSYEIDRETFPIPDMNKPSSVCMVIRQMSLIAHSSRRGSGNTIIIGDSSLFDSLIHGNNRLKETCLITRSNLLASNQMIIGYRGETNEAIDSGVIFTPSLFKDELGQFYFHVDIVPEYFRILELDR